MTTIYEDRRRGQIYRPPPTSGINRYAQKRSSLYERSYHPPYSALSDTSSDARWTCGSESEVSEPESDASSAEVEELHINPIKGYSLHTVVAIIVVIFLSETPLRLPYFLALFFAIPSLHIMLTPVPSNKSPDSHIEALYRRSSDMPSDSSRSSASSPTTQTAAWFTSFIPWTLQQRKNLFTDYTESHYRPHRTYREAFSDTIPRVAKSVFECVYSIVRFQLRFRALLITVQNICAFLTGGEVNAEEYLDDIVRFYVDWIVGISGLVWFVVKMVLEDAVRGFRALFGLLWMWPVRYGNGGVPIAKRKARSTGARSVFRSTKEPLVSVIKRY